MDMGFAELDVAAMVDTVAALPRSKSCPQLRSKEE
jgi:hypothetical protein